jgi:hypothetical protein
MIDNYEPIPFAGLISLDLEDFIRETYGENPENMPKYVILGDGAVYIYYKERGQYALREQAKTVQERVPTAESSGGTTCPQCSGTSPLCDGQEGCGQAGQGY